MILFAVNDAGPAKYLAHIAKSLKNEKYLCLASAISVKVFASMDINCLDSIDDLDFDSIDIILTGTCLGDGLDKELVRIGKNKNITTISIIEHWSLYKKRFDLNGEYFYPDMIFVNDNQAKFEAESDGLPREKLHVVGNPVLENMKRYNYSNADHLIWRKNLRINAKGSIITFISEDLKDDFDEDSPEFQGFNEFEVMNDILGVISYQDTFIIKLHPAENQKKYDFILKNNPNIIVIKDTNINKLIQFSNVIIGMGSMLLLEASLLTNSVYSYRPNEKIEFIGNKNGMVKKIYNSADLKKKLSVIEKQNFTVINNIFSGSTKFIKSLIKKSI
jgi:hypothetical protein